MDDLRNLSITKKGKVKLKVKNVGKYWNKLRKREQTTTATKGDRLKRGTGDRIKKIKIKCIQCIVEKLRGWVNKTLVSSYKE